MPDPFTIPTAHDPATRELLACWEVLRRAGRFDWDEDWRGSRYQLPTLPIYAPLLKDLRDAGLDPDTRESLSHDEAIARLQQRCAPWSQADAAAAFVAGLWSAPAAWRSALPGLLVARTLPAHAFTPWSDDVPTLCEVCGHREGPDQAVCEWAFRLTEGAPLDGVPQAYAQVLGWLGEGRPTPTTYDRWALGAIRAVLRGLPAGTRYAAAAKAITSARILRGVGTAVNVLENLALMGVLAPADRPGMAERYTTYRQRDQRPSTRVEVQAPLAWWDTRVGEHGIRTEVFDALFGALDIPTVDLNAPRPQPVPAAKDTLDGGLAARMRARTPKLPTAAPSVGHGPAAAGDVWAIRLEPGRWVSVYVHEVRERAVYTRGQVSGHRAHAHAEFLRGVHTEAPTAAELAERGLRVQPRQNGRSATWVHSLEKTAWVRRVAQGMPAPAGDEARPADGSWCAAKELRQLFAWHDFD